MSSGIVLRLSDQSVTFRSSEILDEHHVAGRASTRQGEFFSIPRPCEGPNPEIFVMCKLLWRAAVQRQGPYIRSSLNVANKGYRASVKGPLYYSESASAGVILPFRKLDTCDR